LRLGVTTEGAGIHAAACVSCPCRRGNAEDAAPVKDERAHLGDAGRPMMDGVDDYPKGTEVTDLAAAQKLLTFALSRA
jgi:hypothetical protein